MDIRITWFNDQFNVALASNPGADEFLVVKGCRIASGSKGEFLSYPATKNQNTGKYWQHVWGSDRFNDAVLSKARESQPKPATSSRRPARQDDGDDSSIPF